MLAKKEVLMINNRNLIIGAVVMVVVMGAYFLITARDAGQPRPTPVTKTEPKK